MIIKNFLQHVNQTVFTLGTATLATVITMFFIVKKISLLPSNTQFYAITGCFFAFYFLSYTLFLKLNYWKIIVMTSTNILLVSTSIFFLHTINSNHRLQELAKQCIKETCLANNSFIPQQKNLCPAYQQIIFNEILKKLNGDTTKKSSLLLGDLRIEYFGPGSMIQLLDEIYSNQIYTFKTNSLKPFILDCGSNIGLSIIFFKTLYPNAEIIGFEPHPQTFAALNKNIHQNKITGVTLIQKALTAHGQPIKFSDNPGALDAGIESQSTLFVESVKLSQFITKPVDFLKIDIEGGEVDVFEELNKEQKLPLIKQMICEYHTCVHHSSQTLLRFLTVLQDNGFEFRIFDLNFNYKKVSKDGPAAMLIYAYQASQSA